MCVSERERERERRREGGVKREGEDGVREGYIKGGRKRERLISTCKKIECTIADGGASSDCVSQEEFNAVRAEMNQLHSQLHYWQNVTVNIFKDHYSSLDTRGMQ